MISREYMQRMSIWKEYGHQEMDFEPRAQEVSPFEAILLRMQALHPMKHALTIFQTFPHVYFWHDGWSCLVAGFTFFAPRFPRFCQLLGSVASRVFHLQVSWQLATQVPKSSPFWHNSLRNVEQYKEKTPLEKGYYQFQTFQTLNISLKFCNRRY